MKRLSTLVLFLGATGPSHAQAPASAFLWKLADQTLATPAALVRGPTGMFWNPALVAEGRRGLAGIQFVRAPDVVGIDGFVFGVSTPVAGPLSVGLMLGRLDMRDIVRTTSSPLSQLGTIPIYDQVAGVTVAASAGPVSFGAGMRAHDSRFDVENESGVTSDIGVLVAPLPGLVVAASTHFQPVAVRRDEATEYLVGAEYEVGELPVGSDSLGLKLRYGFSSAARGRIDHLAGVEISVRGAVRLAAVVTREEGPVTVDYRPTVEVAMELGRYLVGVARSEGLNGLGATYRINFDLMLTQ